MSLIYAAEPDALRARDRAFSLDEARLAAGDDPDKKLKWMLTAPDDSYAPYLVKIHAIEGARVTFSFIDCTTGDVMAGRHTIDRNDRDLVWDKLPSTLDGWSPGTTDCAFLFFSSRIHGLTEEAAESGGGTGKYPRGDALVAPLGEVGAGTGR